MGYLDDGTMVVVEDAVEAVGRTQDVLVTNVLQTPRGRLVFARLPEPVPGEDADRQADLRSVAPPAGAEPTR